MPTTPDPYLWLEEVQGERALAWAKERNAQSQTLLEAVPGFAESRDKLLAVLNNRDQSPYVSRRGDHVYNFWRDASNPRGLWRRSTLAEYRKAAPQWGNAHRPGRFGQGRRGKLGSGAAPTACAPGQYPLPVVLVSRRCGCNRGAGI
jgi:hypothetical protein